MHDRYFDKKTTATRKYRTRPPGKSSITIRRLREREMQRKNNGQIEGYFFNKKKVVRNEPSL